MKCIYYFNHGVYLMKCTWMCTPELTVLPLVAGSFLLLGRDWIVRMIPAACKNRLSRDCTWGFIPDNPVPFIVKIGWSCCQVNTLKCRHGIYQEFLYLYAELLPPFAWVRKPFLSVPWPRALGFPFRAAPGRAMAWEGEHPWSSKEPGSSLVSHLSCSGHTQSHSD